jgi:hypothetical protein
MTHPRPAMPLRRLVTAALVFVCLGAPLAAQDGPRPMPGAGGAITVAVASMPGDPREVRPVRDAQITVSRLAMPGEMVAAIADDAVAAPGTMLLVLAAMMLWIAGRRR